MGLLLSGNHFSSKAHWPLFYDVGLSGWVWLDTIGDRVLPVKEEHACRPSGMLDNPLISMSIAPIRPGISDEKPKRVCQKNPWGPSPKYSGFGYEWFFLEKNRIYVIFKMILEG